MIETLATLALGTASSLIANIIGRKLPASSEKQLKKEFDSALTEAAAQLAERHPNLVALREQVLNLLPIASEDFLPFLNSLAARESVNQPELIGPIRRRLDAARDGTSLANYIGLFSATDIELHDLLVDYVRLIDQRVSYKPQLRSYYVFLLSKRLTAAVEEASSDTSAALIEIRELLHRLEDINRRLVIVHAVRPDAGEFVPYSPDEQKGRALRYFAGRAPSWQDAATDFGIRRQRFRNDVRVCLEQVTESKALLVSAVAGAGKSTEIKRLALEIAREGRFTVYELRYFGADTARLLAEIEDVVSSEPEDRILMMLADGAAAHLDTLKEVALRVRDRRPIVWVLCDRTERWADALEHPPGETKPVELGVDTVEHVPLLHLTGAEILALADHLVGWEILSEETPREKWAERFEQSYAGQLLVTLLEIRDEGGNFKARLRQEAEQFGERVGELAAGSAALKNLYPAVAALHRFGISPERRWLLQWLEVGGSSEALANEKAIQDALEAEVLVAASGDRLQCRHEVIAEVIATELLRGRMLTEVYDTWIRCTDPEDRSQTDELTRLFNLNVYRRRLWNVPDRLSLYQSLREHLPNHFVAGNAAAYCAIKSGRADLAEQWLEESGGQDRMLLQLLAGRAARRGETARAQEYFNRALGADAEAAPDETVALLEASEGSVDAALLSEWAGFLKEKLARLDLAERVYRFLIGAGEADSLVYREFIWTRHRLGASPEEIDNLISQAEQDYPKYVPFFVMLRAVLDPEHRKEILTRAVREAREDAVVRFQYVRGLPHGTDAEKNVAAAEYRAAIGKYPKHSHLRHGLAEFLLGCDRREDARREYLKGVDLDPSHTAFYNSLALLYASERNWSEAERWFRLGIAADPTNAFLRQTYALFLDRRGRGEEAEAQFQAGIAADPIDAHLYQAYALFLDRRGRGEEAEAQFQAGIAADATNAHLYQAHALFLDRRGRGEEAEAQFQEGIAAEPTNAHLWAALVRFYSNHWLRRAAADSGRDSLKIAAVSPPLTQTIARCLWALRSYDEAVKIAEEGWRLLSELGYSKHERPRWWAAQAQTLAEYYANLGRTDEALAVIREAEEIAHDDQRLRQLEERLSAGDWSRRRTEGRIIASGQLGTTKEKPSPSGYVWVYPLGAERGVYARPDRNPSMPEEGWHPGPTLVYDVWEYPDGNTVAINVELQEWQWKGIGHHILSASEVKPIPKRAADVYEEPEDTNHSDTH